MKVDELYMENLTEYVFDDNLFVTYKFLSIKLGVHVNLAKQMLYHFHDTHKSKGKKIHAMYYLSGLAPQRWISSIGLKKGDDDEDLLPSQDSQDYDRDAYLVMLCKDRELEEYKKKFTRLYSVHVYGLSSFPLEDFNVLNQAAQKPLRDDDGNAPVHFGPITCKAAFEYREDPVIAPLLKNLQEVKANLVKTKEKHEKEMQKQTTEVKPKHVPEKTESDRAVSPSKGRQGTSKKQNDKSSKGGGGGTDRLKNMFAAAATRPKSKEVEKPKEPVKVVPVNDSSDEEEEEKPKKSSNNKTKGKSNNKTQTKTKPKGNHGRESQSRKRKRIKDVFSSSSDEDEVRDKNKMSDTDEDGNYLPESPVPRKKIQIDSDSDDDFKKETPVKIVPTPVETTSSGKRRVCKSVPKRHVDDDGFLVTVLEQVMVSESDQSEDEKEKEKETKKPDPENKPQNKKKNVRPSSETVLPSSSAAGRKKESGRPVSSTSTTSNSAKTKQASIMSFFQKK